MTQGSIMNPNTPAAIVAPSTAPAVPSIIAKWRATNHHSSSDHAIYALARMVHRFSTEHESLPEAAENELALRKLVRTFPPVRKMSKITNGRRPFASLFAQLDAVRMGRISDSWGFDPTLTSDIVSLAKELFAEARLRGNEGLLRLAPTEPPPRVKKPYVRK